MIGMARTRTQMDGARASRPEHAVERVSGLDDLADAFLAMRDRDEAKRFLRDLCTLPELEALAHRWQIARLVDRGVPYLEIAERVPSSTATVTRVAQWLRHGAGGYRLALDRLVARRR
jgi:TrpR-related protein YerC/YecD